MDAELLTDVTYHRPPPAQQEPERNLAVAAPQTGFKLMKEI